MGTFAVLFPFLVWQGYARLAPVVVRHHRLDNVVAFRHTSCCFSEPFCVKVTSKDPRSGEISRRTIHSWTEARYFVNVPPQGQMFVLWEDCTGLLGLLGWEQRLEIHCRDLPSMD